MNLMLETLLPSSTKEPLLPIWGLYLLTKMEHALKFFELASKSCLDQVIGCMAASEIPIFYLIRGKKNNNKWKSAVS